MGGDKASQAGLVSNGWKRVANNKIYNVLLSVRFILGVHYGQGEALIHPYNKGVRAIIRVYKEGVRVG